MTPIKKALIECLIGIPIVFGLAALFDYLYKTLIQQNTYTFSPTTPLFCVGVWVVIVIITHFARKNKQDK